MTETATNTYLKTLKRFRKGLTIKQAKRELRRLELAERFEECEGILKAITTVQEAEPVNSL